MHSILYHTFLMNVFILVSSLIIVVILLMYLRNTKPAITDTDRNISDENRKSLSIPSVSLKSMNLTSDPHCADDWTTCSSGTGSMCCPYSDGVCCTSSL